MGAVAMGLIIDSIAEELVEKGKEMRVVHVGNSHSHSMYPIEYLAHDLGYQHVVGKANILGAPLRLIWEYPEESLWPEVLHANNSWDVITLQGGRPSGEHAVKFMNEVYKGNPACEALIYTVWPNSYSDWNNLSPKNSESNSEKVAAALKEAFPDKPTPRVIPSSLLIRELGFMADQGDLPGVPNRFAMTSDGGHLSKVGMYAIDMLVCAMLYRESPLPYPSVYGESNEDGTLSKEWYGSVDIPEETASLIREMAWNILLTYPPAGMATHLVITDRHLPTVLARRSYKTQLHALNVETSGTWSVSAGTLPDGLSLSSDGVLSGKTIQMGVFPVTIRVMDDQGCFEKILKVRVSRDRPPEIEDIDLKPVPLDTRVFHELEADDGVVPLTWDLMAGKLPFGMQLTSAGILVGTPGEEGMFKCTVRVTDSHPKGRRSAHQTFRWKIEPVSTKTLNISSVIQPRKAEKSSIFRLDGILDEPQWNLEQRIRRNVVGDSDVKAVFDAFWLGDKKGKGNDLCVAVKVLHGAGGKTPKDAVHIFMDGRHNRETMYNQDDTHIRIPREGEVELIRALTPEWFMDRKVVETEDGYVVEIRIGAAFFQGKGITVPFAAKAVYGFDIAVEDGDEVLRRKTWRGDENADRDTSSFGSILLLDH